MATVLRTPEQAVSWAKAQSVKPSKNWHNLCLQFVRSCYGVAAKWPNAKQGWENAKQRTSTSNAASIPRGVPVWFKTKTVNWHVAISAGNGYCYSTDVGGSGKVGYIGINALCKAWGITLLGWSADVNGVTVYKAPTVPAFPQGLGPGKNKPSAIPLQRQLKKAGFMPNSVVENANYGPATQAAVAKFHNRNPGFRSPGKTYDPAIGPKGWKFLFTNW